MQELDGGGLIFPVFPEHLDGTGGIAGTVPRLVDAGEGAAAKRRQQFVPWYSGHSLHESGLEGNRQIGTRRESKPRSYYRLSPQGRSTESGSEGLKEMAVGRSLG